MTLFHNGKRLENGLLDVADENWIEQPPVKGGIGVGTIVEDRGNGWVDMASPRWWGNGTKNGPFARHHAPNGMPIWSSCREFQDAVKRANDNGDKLQAVRPRDYE